MPKTTADAAAGCATNELCNYAVGLKLRNALQRAKRMQAAAGVFL
jgi:hypothetical protein